MTFIKFTSKSGSSVEERYVNANQISEVVYTPDDGRVSLFIGDRPGGEGDEYFLHGQEAKEALKIIKALRRRLLDGIDE